MMNDPVWRDVQFDQPDAGGFASIISSDKDNPWLTLGIMEKIEDESLLAEWDSVLDTQTRLLAEQEIAWMRQHGLGAGELSILEIGSANGNYGSRLARSFSGKRVFGLEANPSLASRLGPEDCPDNYSIDICKVGDDPLPAHVEGAVDQCFLRFVVQHVSDPVRLLSAVHSALPRGGRIFIIEEDDSFFGSYPESRPFETAFDIWRRVSAAGGSNSKIGRDLPALARQAGFTVDAFDIRLRNNVEAGSRFNELFRGVIQMLHRTNPAIVSDAELKEVIEGLSPSRAGALETIATYPQFYLSAVKE